MPELPELTVVQEVLTRRILDQTIVSSDVIPPGGLIVVRDLTGAGFAAARAGACFESVARRGKFLVFRPAGGAIDGGFLWWNRNGDRCDQVRWNQRHVSAACV